MLQGRRERLPGSPFQTFKPKKPKKISPHSRLYRQTTTFVFVSTAVYKLRSWLAKLARLVGFRLDDYQPAGKAQQLPAASPSASEEYYVIVIDEETSSQDGIASEDTTSEDTATREDSAVDITSSNDEDSTEAAATSTPAAKKLTPEQWTALNQLANCSAAWQIRRRMPLDVADLDSELFKGLKRSNCAPFITSCRRSRGLDNTKWSTPPAWTR
ncbi:hypothetical protein PHYBOEH_001605 [Phytophthora boehmeriae]|uniref:Uncharacterized protein n=1 Tax=Phytophthora boehmeriae TaxID=109152 RepID=A0A8T1WXA6_9STRA|nr:hypothetical protein PHYBOEH_001605 [Phytophthora boehmeriae]